MGQVEAKGNHRAQAIAALIAQGNGSVVERCQTWALFKAGDHWIRQIDLDSILTPHVLAFYILELSRDGQCSGQMLKDFLFLVDDYCRRKHGKSAIEFFAYEDT